MKANKIYKGEFNITHVTGSEIFEISVEDSLSRVNFIQFMMTARDLMLALTGRCSLPCDFELRGLPLVGKRHENKEEVIPEIDSYLSNSEFLGVVEKVRQRYEVDGWMIDEQRGFNHHNLERGGYRVILRRYVDVE
jgi:hypothetical protein